MIKRPTNGRALFYTRDSGGQHEMTPAQYVNWAVTGARKCQLSFRGTSEQIDRMIAARQSQDRDLFLDYLVKGNLLSRPGLDAMLAVMQTDTSVSHVFIPRPDRLARPENPTDGLKLEMRIRELGITVVFQDRIGKPIAPRQRHDIGELITCMIDYHRAGKDRRDRGVVEISQCLLRRLGGRLVGFASRARRNLVFYHH